MTDPNHDPEAVLQPSAATVDPALEVQPVEENPQIDPEILEALQ